MATRDNKRILRRSIHPSTQSPNIDRKEVLRFLDDPDEYGGLKQRLKDPTLSYKERKLIEAAIEAANPPVVPPPSSNIPTDDELRVLFTGDTVIDESDNAYALTNNGSTTADDRFSEANNARNFVAASNHYVDIDDVLTSMGTATTGSMFLWIELVDITPSVIHEFIGFGDSSSTESIRFVMRTTGELQVICGESGISNWSIITTNSITEGQHCIGYTFDGENCIIYIDGKPVEAAYNITTDKTYYFNDATNLDTGRLGTTYRDGGHLGFHDGDMDDVRIYSRVLTPAEIEAIFLEGVDLTRDNELLVTFDGDTVVDDSDNAYSLTNNGSTAVDDRFGEVDYARTFATNDYIDDDGTIPAALDGQAEGSVSFWLKAPTPGATETIFCLTPTSGIGTTYLTVFLASTGKVNLSIRDNTTWRTQVVADDIVMSDEWVHFVITADGTTIRIYSNGQESATTTTQGTNAGQWLSAITVQDPVEEIRLGCYWNKTLSTNQLFLNGELDEFKYYSRALNPAEIYSLYNQTGTWDISQLTGLVAWYDGADVDYKSGGAQDYTTIDTGVSQLDDRSGNGHHVSNGTTTEQPERITDGIRFDGVDEILKAGSALEKSNDGTIIIISSDNGHDGESGQGVLAGWGNQSTSSSEYWFAAINMGKETTTSLTNEIMSMSQRTVVGATTTRIMGHIDSDKTVYFDGEKHMTANTSDGTDPDTDWKFYLDGVEHDFDHTDTFGDSVNRWNNFANIDEFSIGGRVRDGADNWAQADIFEVIVLNRRITAEDLSNINAYVEAKWGIAAP